MISFRLITLPGLIRKLIADHPNVTRVATNSGWMFAQRISQLLVSFVVGLWVARYLGPEDYGAYNYALALVGLVSSFLSLGLSEIIVRDVVKDTASRYAVLGTAFFMRLIAAVVATIVCVAIALIFHRQEPSILQLLLILAVLPLLSPWDTIVSWFNSQLQSKHAVIAQTVSVGVIAIGRSLLVLIAAPLWAFAVALLLSQVASTVTLIRRYRHVGESIRRWSYSPSIMRRHLREGLPLMFTAIAIGLYMRSDQIMLRQMVGDEAAGLYSAAVRISELWYFVPTALASSLFPVITAAKQRSETEYYRKLQLSFRLMAAMAIGVALIMTLVSGRVVSLLYGSTYTEAGPILAIHIWAGIPVALGVASSVWLLNEGYSRIALQRTLFGAVVNIVLNFTLIPQYAGLGAAIATVIAQLCAALLWHLIDPKTRPLAMLQLKALLVPYRN